jgi:DNA modification methylase
MVASPERIEFTQSNAGLNYATHGYFRYFGKLPPSVTRFAIQKGLENAPDGEIVDLMCGSGTSLVESMLLGVNCLGIDVNPLSVLISRVKTTLLPVDTLEQEMERLCHLLDRDISALNSQQTLAYTNRKRPDLSFIEREQPSFRNKEYWFAKPIAEKLAIIKHHVSKITDENVKAFFQVALFSIVRRVSNASPRIGRLFHIDTPLSLDVLSIFTERCRHMFSGMEDFTKMEPRGIARTQISDARDTRLESESFSFVFVHPPYYALYKYSSDVLRLELEWAGFERKEIVKGEIRDGFKTSDINTFDNYINDFANVLQEGYRILKPNCKLCVVVSNSTLGDVRLPVTDRITDKAVDLGFSVDSCYLRGVKYSSASYHRSARADKKTQEDYLLFFRK